MRTWNLRMNLDDFNAAFMVLCDDLERSYFLQGFAAGINAAPKRTLEGRLGDCLSEGQALGSRMRQEADGLRNSCAMAGKLGGRKRVANEAASKRTLEQVPEHLPEQVLNQISSECLSLSFNPSSTTVQVPPLPPKGGKKPRSERLKEALLKIPNVDDRHMQAGTYMVKIWRKEDGEDGRKITADLRKVVMRLSEIERRQPRYTMSVMVNAAKAYLEAPRLRYKSPENWLSLQPDEATGKPPFKEFADAEVFRQEREGAAV